MDGEKNPEFDAQTLAEAEVIKADPTRYSDAQKAATQLAKDAEVRAKSFDAITKKHYPTMADGHPRSQKE